ncbi:TonB-dependent receptor plug domain-containing protein [Pseudoalteromonas spongiae]|uniref:TonB-dependent receptor plug domain-containing protein n=1 Tax=Pseudoalteromonas spongiae TaxID=298657 RepID=UPI003736357F
MKFISLPLICLVVLPSLYASEYEDVFDLSLNDLFQLEITTASNRSEHIENAPATVIVVSKDDIKHRGYESIDEIFLDLPGMEMIYTHGDSYFSNYMRGYRYTIGTPFLMMLDGISINSLYFNQITQISSFPLSSVERIEVVYGPASVIYGANAFMGVVNIITKKPEQSGTNFTANTRSSGHNDHNFDMSYNYKDASFLTRFGMHYEEFNVNDRIDNNANYWLQEQHYSTALWGGFIDQTNVISNNFSSKTKRLGLETLVAFDELELSAFYLLEQNGYGATYPSDRLPASGKWPIYQYGGTIKYTTKLSDSLESRSRFHAQSDGIKGDGYDIEAWNVVNSSEIDQVIGGVELAPNEAARMMHFQYWLTKNHSLSFNQDFDYRLSDTIKLLTGIKYDYQDLQRSYVLSTTGPISPLASLPSLPNPASGAYSDDSNREIWRDFGFYLQGEYKFKQSHMLSGGLRYDDNNIYGGETTFRGAYIYNHQKWNIKLMYGEAYHEPTPRNLYGAWSGLGADPNLSPERSRTIESTLAYQGNDYRHLLSLYHVKNTDSIVTTLGGAENIGARSVTGIDYHYVKSIDNTAFGDWQLNLYATHYFQTEEDTIDTVQQVRTGTAKIGDLADTKLWFIANWRASEFININFKTRLIDKRKTIASNPLDQLPGYGVSDLAMQFTVPNLKSITFTLRVTNLFDKAYYHPGIRDADANDPLVNQALLNDIGFLPDNPKAWSGSQGWYNSRLPQAERRISLGMTFNF